MSDQKELEEDGFYDSSGSQEQLPWIIWFCSIVGHEYFSEVPEDYILDDFNLCGLSSCFENYDRIIDLILDNEPQEDYTDVEQANKEEEEAERLYSLIHQRYILTRHGLQQMYAKYQRSDFGLCPRDLCYGAHMLPVGTSDFIGVGTVKLYCPSCMDIYNPPSSRFNSVDGAGFGTTFPHLFMLTYPEVLFAYNIPADRPLIHEERIFGFRVSSQAVSGPKMKWLRRFIRPEDYAEGEREVAEFDKQQLEEPMEDDYHDASAMDDSQNFNCLMDSEQLPIDASPLRSMVMTNSDSNMSINPIAGNTNLNGE